MLGRRYLQEYLRSKFYMRRGEHCSPAHKLRTGLIAGEHTATSLLAKIASNLEFAPTLQICIFIIKSKPVGT